MDARVATGDRLPSRQYLFHNKAKGQGRHPKVNALDPQRGQAHHNAHRCGERRCCGQSDGKRHPHIAKYRLGIGAHPQKRGMAERKQTGKTREQHDAQRRNAVDDHKGELRQPVFGKQPGSG